MRLIEMVNLKPLKVASGSYSGNRLWAAMNMASYYSSPQTKDIITVSHASSPLRTITPHHALTSTKISKKTINSAMERMRRRNPMGHYPMTESAYRTLRGKLLEFTSAEVATLGLGGYAASAAAHRATKKNHPRLAKVAKYSRAAFGGATLGAIAPILAPASAHRHGGIYWNNATRNYLLTVGAGAALGVGHRLYKERHTQRESTDICFNNLIEAESLRGGRGDGKPDSKFPAKQLRRGVKVEREHTKNPRVAKEIAKDHLTEFKDYYTRLAKMERQAKKGK